jgi:hypothetical protein
MLKGYCTSIVDVTLSWIPLDYNLDLFCKVLETNRTIRSLDLRCCLSTAGKLRLAQALGKNGALSSVQLWYFKTWFFSQEEKEARELLRIRFPDV